MTPYKELDEVLIHHIGAIKNVLGDNFIGAYLQGSLAIGDFDLTSDIDFLIVTEEDLSEEEVENIQQVHNRTYNLDNRWVKRLEYSFFPLNILRDLSSPYSSKGPNDSSSRMLWYFNNGDRKIEKSDHCNTLVTRWTVREKGLTLAGPQPSTIIPPITTSELRNEIKNTLVGWGQELLDNPEPYRNRFYQSYLVLNFCRMVHDLNEGVIDSKLAGVKWAKNHLDASWLELIDFCWQERQDSEISVKQPADPDVFPKTIKFVDYAVNLGKSYEIVNS